MRFWSWTNVDSILRNYKIAGSIIALNGQIHQITAKTY